MLISYVLNKAPVFISVGVVIPGVPGYVIGVRVLSYGDPFPPIIGSSLILSILGLLEGIPLPFPSLSLLASAGGGSMPFSLSDRSFQA